MIRLYADDRYTFRFAEPRLIPRIHLQDAPVGAKVQLWPLQDSLSNLSTLPLRESLVGPNGWVELEPPLIVSPEAGFVAKVV